MITSCNHSENIICGSCLMKNHQEKQVTENLLRGELLRRTLPYLEASLLGRLYSEMDCRDDEYGGVLFSRNDFEKVRLAIKLAMEG